MGATADTSVGVSILGVIQARTPSGVVPVPGIKLQALLALLALAAPHPVSADRLIDELWGERPPSKPNNALQAQISQLRRILGRSTVVRESAGYALAVEPDDVDALRLERLVTAGREAASGGDHRAAAACYTDAVRLVRGAPLSDLIDHHFAREAATRLEQLALDANECLVDAQLAVGGHAEVVDRLTELVQAHPLRERFHAQLITALYRCGRQSDALRAYQYVRAALADELGIDPGSELQALERAVLSHDPTLSAPIPLSLGVPTAVLPIPLTSFVGRGQELDALVETISSARLVTVVGPGGMGKTRLALEAARRLAGEREVWFVDLSPVADPDAVAETVATAVGAHDHAEDPEAFRPPEVRTIDRLSHRDVIVVIDNCEHLADAAARCVRTLLIGCPRLTILATSREPLGVDAERQLNLSSLSDTDATALFMERARSVQPQFGADDANATVTAVCRRLDGLPLAIELAAARTKTLPLPEIAARLDDRFTLLRSTSRDGGGRHHGLAATIDWSYELLFDDERRMFRQLAVFAGGATVDAARVLCGDDALDILTRLVDRSLLIADTSGDESRFRMLESLRAYAIQRLAAEGELDDALRAHARWCTALAEQAEPHLGGERQLVWLDRLDVEHDNMRSALAYASTNDPNNGLRLIAALIVPWWFRGRRQEARHWLEVCLSIATEAPPSIRMKALSLCGLLADAGGATARPRRLEQELDLAEQRQREAITLALEVGRERPTAYARLGLILTLTERAIGGVGIDMAELTDLVRMTAEVFERKRDDFGGGLLRQAEAVAAVAAGDLHHAAVATEAARAHAARSGDRFTAARVAWLDGLLRESSGDLHGAYRHIARCVELLDQLGLGQAVTAQAALLIPLAERTGQHELAAQWREFVANRSGGTDRVDITIIAAARNSTGLEARQSHEHERARTAHLQALASYREAGIAGGVAFTESCLGFLIAAMGDSEDAAVHHSAALEAATVAGEPASLALAFEGIASANDETDSTWAATVLGAATTLWQQSPARLTRTHRADVEATTRLLRDRLGDVQFAVDFDRGRSLDRLEALAVVRVRMISHG